MQRATNYELAFKIKLGLFMEHLHEALARDSLVMHVPGTSNMESNAHSTV